MDRRYRSSLVTGLLAMLAACGSEPRITESAIGDEPLLKKGHKPGPPVAFSNAVMDIQGCDITVTFTWYNYSGGNLVARLELVTEAGPFIHYDIAGQTGNSGSASHTFNLTDIGVDRYVYAHGSLQKDDKEVSDSRAGSQSAWSNCGVR